MPTQPTAVPRQVVEAFYDAYSRRDFARVADFLDDDVDWSVIGPVDVIHFCGRHRGKAAAMEFFLRKVPDVMAISAFRVEELLVDGDRAAAFARLWAHCHRTNRRISYRLSHLVHFRNEKVVRFCSMIDSFDAAEQMLGYPIAAQPEEEPVWSGNLVAV